MSMTEAIPIILLHNGKENYSTFFAPAKDDTDKYTTTFDTYKGLLFMFLSCVLKSIFGFLCKVILERNPTLTSFHLMTYKVYWMVAIALIILLFTYQFNPKAIEEMTSISKSSMIQLCLRAVLSVISGSLTILSLKYMPISDVYAIYYLYPGLVIIMSYVFLKERVGLLDIICLIACLIGVLCVIRPSLLFERKILLLETSSVYFVYVFIAAIFKGIEDIIIRNAGKQIHFLTIPIVYSIVGMVLFPIPMIFFTKPHEIYVNLTIGDWSIFILLAIVNFTYQALLAMAIQNENVGRASMVNYFQVLFMFLTDIFIFGREIIFLDFFGIGLIFSFNFTNGLLKAYKRNNELYRMKNSYYSSEAEEIALIE